MTDGPVSEDEIIEKVEVLRAAEAPNQILIEAVKIAEFLESITLVMRDVNGTLHVVDSEQTTGELCEAAALLSAIAHQEVYDQHDGGQHEELGEEEEGDDGED